ncbi:MAG: cytochrome b/b6 domain-containing protein [Thermodesulfobacteriota bacterium]|nr:cytochrome b/b6 domain-containing protein [Thermodesulfobacteriota bacterium]
MTERIIADKGLVVRHEIIELIEHWTIAISGLVLILTGLFELPIAKRYYITEIPGLGWSGDFFLSLELHYIAAAFFVTAALFHVIYHSMLGHKGILPQKGDMRESMLVIKSFFSKVEEPPFKKYLPEQRLAYVGMAAIIAMLIITGLVKTYKNVFDPQINETLLLVSTWGHNIFFALFVLAFVAHMVAIIIKPNRPMVRGIFTAKVRLDYARARHPLWIEEIEVSADSKTGEKKIEDT